MFAVFVGPGGHEFRYHARNGGTGMAFHQRGEVCRGIVGLQQRVDLQWGQFGARYAAFRRHGDASDAMATHHGQQ